MENVTLACESRGARSVVGLVLSVLMACGCENPTTSVEPYEPPAPPPRTARSLEHYASLCDGEAPFDGATKYDEDGESTAQLALFEKYVEAHEPAFRPAAPRYLEGWLAKKPDEVTLVVCVGLKKKKLRRVCDFEGGNKLEIYDMAHEVRVIEARTGKVRLDEEFELGGHDECPTLSSFSSTVHFRGTEYAPKLLSLLRPLQPKGAELPKLDSYLDLGSVCAGNPLPQTAAYVPASKEPRHLYATFRQTDGAPFSIDNVPNGFYTDRPPEEDPRAYQLVACVTGKPEKKARDCRFDGDGIVEIHDGTVEVAIHESATAKLVEKKTFRAAGGTCPFIYKFEHNSNTGVVLGALEPAYRRYLDGLSNLPK
jgi:hypothetical protein